MNYQGVRMKSGVAFFQTGPRRFSWLLLAVFVFLVYAPFLGNRVVRPAGDDKVYVSQAVEMAERGAWFLQTLAGEPDYYKGPAHYIFLRIGMAFFGPSMWATVYMNLILVILGAISLGSLVYRRLPEREGWGFWAGVSFALCAGVYSHMYASQMEVELASLFAIGLHLLDKAGPGKPDLRFWLLAGFAGWFKSPLHSVLLGTTALLFWGLQRELWARCKSGRAWGALFAGILLCTAGYLPALIGDRENFINAYVLRETLWKPANGSRWFYPVIPFFTYFLMPWTAVALVAFLDGLTRPLRKRAPYLAPNAKRLLRLGICLAVPTVAFFAYHPYRGQNYMLPAISGLILVVGTLWSARSESWSKYYSLALLFTVGVVLAVPVLLTALSLHFDPMPFWWPSWLLPVIWLGAVLTARGLYREGITLSLSRPDSLARRLFWMYLALGSLLTVLGEREMVDIRLRLAHAQANRETFQVSYYNLEKNIWSEWGYLNFMVPHPTHGIFSLEQLKAAIVRRDLILVPGDAFMDEFRKHAATFFPRVKFDVQPWRRWKTKGKNAEGIPAWREAWDKRDLSLLEKQFYLVRPLP